MKDHLSNVRVLVSDVKSPLLASGAIYSGEADVLSYNNYYPFGMLQPQKNYNATDYRYGFNGKEKDDEIEGSGNSYDYGARIYDSRLGRFLSIDLLTAGYPWYTPYQFAGNTPIQAIDLDGLEEYVIIRWYDSDNKYVGSTTFNVEESKRLENAQTGTLIRNVHSNEQAAVNAELDNGGVGDITMNVLYNRNSEGRATSLKGGLIVEESPNKSERIGVSLVKPRANDRGSITRVQKQTFNPRIIEFEEADNTVPIDQAQIETFKTYLADNPEFKIEVAGYASEEPGVSDAHNNKVANDRASSVKGSLVAGGISGNKITAEGKGTSNPRASNQNEEGRKKNRRAEIKYTKPKKQSYD